jgi:hypothetical protein
MQNFFKPIFTVRCRPGQDTALAFVTALLMVPAFHVGTHSPTSILGLLVFVIFGNGILNVLFPAYYMLVWRKESPRELAHALVAGVVGWQQHRHIAGGLLLRLVRRGYLRDHPVGPGSRNSLDDLARR